MELSLKINLYFSHSILLNKPFAVRFGKHSYTQFHSKHVFHVCRILSLYVDVSQVKTSFAIWIMWELSSLMWSLHLAEGKDILISLIVSAEGKWNEICRDIYFSTRLVRKLHRKIDRTPKRELTWILPFFLISCFSLTSFPLSTSAQAERYKVLLYFFMPIPTAFASF